MRVAPIQNRSMQKVINVDHSGRSLSPLPTRATGNYISTPTRCRLSAADTESIRKLSRSFSKEMSDLMKPDENVFENNLLSCCDDEIDEAPVSTKSTTARVSWCPDDVNVKTASNKSTPNVRVAAAPVSMRSIPIASQLRNTAYDIQSKSLPVSPTVSQPSSPTSSSDFFEKSQPADFSCPYSVTPTQPSANMVTPPNSSASLRIETTPSTGTPSKKTAAAPVSVRSTNKPPPIIVEHDQYSSINSSPRSGTPSPRAKVTFPRYSNVVILGASSSKGKQNVGHATFEKWDSGSPSNVNNRGNSGILQTLYKQKDAFFSRNRNKIDRSSSNSEHYLSSPSLASEDGDSFKSQFSPKTTSSSGAHGWSPVKLASRFDESMLKGVDSGGKKEIPIGMKTLKKLSPGRRFTDDLSKCSDNQSGLSSLETSFKGSPRKTIATSVSSLWAFATEFPSADKEDIERPKVNRISPDAIAGAIARQGGKMTSPFHSNLLASFIPHIGSGKTSSGTSEKSFCRTPVDDVRRSLPLSSRRRRSSAPSMGMEESEVDSDAEGIPSPGSKRGARLKMAERAVSLPTISCDTSNQFHTTFISSLWDLAAEYSDYEKDKISRSSSRTPSQKNSMIRPQNGNQ